jgi:hypothetical protein
MFQLLTKFGHFKCIDRADIYNEKKRALRTVSRHVLVFASENGKFPSKLLWARATSLLFAGGLLFEVYKPELKIFFRIFSQPPSREFPPGTHCTYL